MEEDDEVLAQSKPKSAQYGNHLAVKVFRLASNARANLFSKIRDGITKHLAFYRRIILDSFWVPSS